MLMIVEMIQQPADHAEQAPPPNTLQCNTSSILEREALGLHHGEPASRSWSFYQLVTVPFLSVSSAGTRIRFQNSVYSGSLFKSCVGLYHKSAQATLRQL